MSNEFVAGGLAGTVDCERFEVWFDGVREPLAIRANTQWGYIERYVTNADGEIVQDAATGNGRTERLFGTVKIRNCNPRCSPDPRPRP